MFQKKSHPVKKKKKKIMPNPQKIKRKRKKRQCKCLRKKGIKKWQLAM